MGEFRVHHARFFEYTPSAIHCLSYDYESRKLAVSRADGSLEIWAGNHNWYQEKVLSPQTGHSIEALCWVGGDLFSAGLSGDLLHYDLVKLTVRNCVPSNSGAIWCLAKNLVGSHIAAGTEDGCVVLYEVTKNGVEFERSLDRQPGRILSVAWYDAENILVTGGVDIIRIWSVSSGHAVDRLTVAKVHNQRDTLVWTVAVTNDFTIISGDSRGRTCFWNGRQGTVLREFQSHKADVLCLAVNRTGTLVFAGGVDPVLAQFEYVPINPNSDLKMWVKGQPRYQHTHDIRAVALTDDCVISAGVDCQVIINRLMSRDGVLTWRRHSALPQQPLAYAAKASHMVMLRYSDYLELWRLGSARGTSSGSNEILPLRTNPIKLLQLKSKNAQPIVCAAVSTQADWIAYSDASALRIFHLSIENTDSACPGASIARLRSLPAGTFPARLMALTSDADSNISKLVLASVRNTIQVLALDHGTEQASLVATFDLSTVDTIHLLHVSESGKYIAVANNSSLIAVYDIKRQRHIVDLPSRSEHLPTAMALHPCHPEIVVVYSDMKIMEYNFRSMQYTNWSRRLNARYHHLWLKRHSKITQVMYSPYNSQQIYLRDELIFCIIDKTQRLPKPSDSLYHPEGAGKSDDRHAFHICSKYKYLLHLDIVGPGELLVIERPPLAVLESFPPTLKQKKFGAG